jgi:hypothetical protein
MGYKPKTFTVTLSTAGVAERIVLPANDIRSRAIFIQNDHDNTGYVCFGGVEVDAVTKGIRLEPGDSSKYSLIEYNDTEAEVRMSEVYLVASANSTLVRLAHDYEDPQ